MNNSDWPVKIQLTKVKTLEDATNPQEEKYPSRETVRSGLMWSHTIPVVGKQFMIMQSKLYPSFITSPVVNVDETHTGWIIKTENSIYEIIINNETT